MTLGRRAPCSVSSATTATKGNDRKRLLRRQTSLGFLHGRDSSAACFSRLWRFLLGNNLWFPYLCLYPNKFTFYVVSLSASQVSVSCHSFPPKCFKDFSYGEMISHPNALDCKLSKGVVGSWLTVFVYRRRRRRSRVQTGNDGHCGLPVSSARLGSESAVNIMLLKVEIIIF